jgi:hypothetical protein
MPTNNRALKVFLCHAEEDKPKVRKLYQFLVSNGIDAWLDEKNLLPGQEWRVEIPKAVREADVVVVCMSSVSARKEGFVQAEINFALDKALEKPEGTIYIIPAKFEECVIPDKLGRWQWVDVYKKDGYKKLLDALKSRADEIDAVISQMSAPGNLETVQLILDGKFSEFNEGKRDDLVGILAALLHVDKSSIRVLRTYPGSIIMEIELTKIGANRLLSYFEKGDIQLKSLGILSVSLSVNQKTRKRVSKPKKDSNKSRPGNILEVESGNQSIVIMGDVIGSNLISGNENKVALSGNIVGKSETKVDISTIGEKFVSDRVLKSWLNQHGLAENPFGKVDFRSHPYYPQGATRPNQWEAFLDPDPLFGLCVTPEDAQVLSYRLRFECLPLKDKDLVDGINHRIFPVWFTHRQTDPIQSPLPTLAYSAAQTWLDILLQNPGQFSELPPAKQDALLDLLLWSFGSANDIIKLLQNHDMEKDVNGLSLIRKIEKFTKEFPTPPVPQDVILLSWLNIRPLDINRTFLIFPGDDILLATPKRWFEQFNTIIPLLLPNGIVTKVIASTRPGSIFPFQEIKLSWSDGHDGWLNRSLQGQFDAAMASEERVMGVATRFHELFGPGATEYQTTANLISASRNSLAGMLTLGNRLLQNHCDKRGADDRFLHLEDLNAILETA